MDYKEVKEVGSWVGGIAGGIGLFFKWFLPVWAASRKAKSDFRSQSRSIRAIYSKMAGAAGLGATRAIIFSGRPGEEPREGYPFHASALHIVVPDSKYPAVADYSDLSVDPAYIRMLLDIQRNGYVRFDCSPAAPDCLLHRIYQAEGVVDSTIFFLCTIEKTFFYMTFASYERKFTDTEVSQLDLKARLIAAEILNSV